MRRWILFLVFVPFVLWAAMTDHTAAEAPLCTLSADFERQIFSAEAIIGAAVYDLQTGTIWTGGHPGPYAMHSVIKPPIAWAVLSDANDDGRQLNKQQLDALFYMVARSRNADVNMLLRMIGGLPGLSRYYEHWGVSELIELMHHSRWGAGRAEPAQLARLYAALAMSDSIPDDVRSQGLDLLRAVIDEQRWGAAIPERALPGWESLIKTGNYTIPESNETDMVVANDSSGDEEETKASVPEADEALPEAEAKKRQTLVRMNSAAIWLAPTWRGIQPRYVVAIMQESFLHWGSSRQLQDQIGAVLANAIVQRESGAWSQPAAHCIKQALY